MDIRKMTSEELDKLSHLDIAYNIIKTEKKVLNTLDLLKDICSLLEYDESVVENLIGDFYTSLNLDKRFILIDGKWDITENHSVKIVVEDEMDDDELDTLEDIDAEEDEAQETEDEAVLDETEVLEDIEDDLDDEMEDLTILSEEEMEEDEENL